MSKAIAYIPSNYQAAVTISGAFRDLVANQASVVEKARVKADDLEVEGAKAAAAGGFGWQDAINGSASAKVGPSAAQKALDLVAQWNAQRDVVRREQNALNRECVAAMSDPLVLRELAEELVRVSRDLNAASEAIQDGKTIAAGIESSLVAGKGSEGALRSARSGANRLVSGHMGGEIDPELLAARCRALGEALASSDDPVVIA